MARIVSSQPYVIPTSAGDYIFEVHHLDVNVESGVELILEQPAPLFPDNVSVVGSGGVLTEFTADDGSIVVLTEATVGKKADIRLYKDGEVAARSTIDIPTSSNKVLVPCCIYLGGNGVGYAYPNIILDTYTVNTTTADVFTPNTESELGTFSTTRSISLFKPKDFGILVAELLLARGEPFEPNNDPYANGGSTKSGGGTGDFDGSSDAIDIPDLPSASATDAGFITLFNPTLSQMQSLASYMWSDLFDLDAWRKIFADPMDAILGLSIVPVKVASSGTREVKVGNISTGVTMDVAASQYVKVDCGTLNVKEYWGAYLDYEPFTKAEIYLPYIGTHPIAVDDIMGKSVHVVYHVDILSGACVAYVKCSDGKLDSVLYNFVGQCSSSIPITGNDWTNVVNGVLSIAGSIGTMVATGGAAAPFAVGEIASSAVNSFKPSVEKSGSVSGTGGLMGIQKPYLILTRPRQAVPKNQYKYTGYPAYINRKLSDLEGYTEVDQIHIEGVYATEQEYSELDSLIRSGVIF